MVACYFPISFSPPPNNVHGITRQDLAAALQDALTCTPLFAPLFIPMLLEKLSSNLRYVLLPRIIRVGKVTSAVWCLSCHVGANCVLQVQFCPRTSHRR